MGSLYAQINGESRKVTALYTRQGGQGKLVSAAWAHVGGTGRNIHTIEETVFSGGVWGAISVGGIERVAYSGEAQPVTDAPEIKLAARTFWTNYTGSTAAATLGTVDVTHYRTLQLFANFAAAQWRQPSAYALIQLTPDRIAKREYWASDNFTGYYFPAGVRSWQYNHSNYSEGISGTFSIDLTGLSGRYYLGFCLKSEYIDRGHVSMTVNNIVLLP